MNELDIDNGAGLESPLAIDQLVGWIITGVKSRIHRLDLLDQLATTDGVELRLQGNLPWFKGNILQMLSLLDEENALWEGSSLVEFIHQPHPKMKVAQMRETLLYLARTDAIVQAADAVDGIRFLRRVSLLPETLIEENPKRNITVTYTDVHDQDVMKVVNADRIQMTVLRNDVTDLENGLKRQWLVLFEENDVAQKALQTFLIGDMNIEKFQESILRLPQLTAHI